MATRFFPNYDNYIITSPFGPRKLWGQTGTHNGIDLVATKDGKTGRTDQITAHTGGTVEKVGYDDNSGNFVRIQVDKQTLMVYCHLRDKPTVKKGDTVAAGQPIGYMGKTGRVTGAHLHFGIRQDGRWIDPEPYLDTDYIQPGKTYDLKLPQLERGSRGDSVKALQILLAGLGHSPGTADGIFGGRTLAGVKGFQKDRGLACDGIVGPKTWEALLGS